MSAALLLLTTLSTVGAATCDAAPGVSGILFIRSPVISGVVVVEIDGKPIARTMIWSAKVRDCSHVRILRDKTVLHEQHVRFTGKQSVVIDLERVGDVVPPLSAWARRGNYCRLPRWRRPNPAARSQLCAAGVAEVEWQRGFRAAKDGRHDVCIAHLRKTLALVPRYEPSAQLESSMRRCIDDARRSFDADEALAIEIRDFRRDDGDLLLRYDVVDSLQMSSSIMVYFEAAGPQYDDTVGEKAFRRRARRVAFSLAPNILQCDGAARSFADCEGPGRIAARFPDVKGPVSYEYRVVLVDRDGHHVFEQLLPALKP